MKECPACRRCFPDDINHCPQDGDATTPSLLGEPILDARYQLEKRLGHGGMGVVFKARHIFLKTPHAIKVILPDLVGNDPMLATRFRQEALAAAAIRHQNIIAVTDFGVVRGTMPFLVMEFVNGKSLQDMLADEGAMPPARALELMSAIGAGVAAAHRQNIVHRDLKPLNIMAQNNVPVAEGLKILDFGLAKIKSGELLGSFIQAKTSGLMGSPFYMAPEQWSDDEPDSRADIYSLGVILYQMLAGDVPFKGSSIPSIMKKHLTMPPASFQSLGIQVPPRIEAVVRHALEKELESRISSVGEFLSELKAAVNSSGATTITRRDTGSIDPERDRFARDELEREAATVIDPEATQIHKAIKPQVVGGDSFPAEFTGVEGRQRAFVEVAPKPKVNPMVNPILLIGAAVVVLLLVGGGIAGYLLLNSAQSLPARGSTTETSTPTPGKPRTDLVEITGGTFQMGRNDGTPQERPQHAVTVQTFLMDRAEVTNEEYAEFVRDRNYEAPSHWLRGKPLPLQDKWPVVNVSPRDAEAFAGWRSNRDGKAYRLPTEEEWEYAARSGGAYKLYPWGDRWEDHRAVIKEADAKPVGSFPEGANRWGVADLIGNVWEWTSSKASLYPGNSEGQIPAATKEWVVARGGAFSSDRKDRQIPISATYRDWFDPTFRHPSFGFRLVRAAR